MFKKSKLTIWTDGRFARTELGEFEHVEDVQSDMTNDRQSHAGFPSTLAIEETATTLVIVKESGTVHVYNWSKD